MLQPSPSPTLAASTLAASTLAAMAGKWCDLALRRRAHFAELYDTGRWRHYYTEDEFVAELRKLSGMIDRWQSLAVDASGVPALPMRLPRAGRLPDAA